MTKKLKADGKKVAVTAATGMTSNIFKDGRTIHSWCGIGTGGLSKEEMVRRTETEVFIHCRDDIKNTDILVIDEIGLLSKKIFDLIEFVIRHVRNCSNPFGDIQ